MSQVRIHLPDNSIKEFDFEPTVLQVAESIGSRLAKDTLGAQINGSEEVIDLRTTLPNDTKLKIITKGSEESLEVIRHSAAHVMAQAVQELWPEVKVTIGPVIENGFFYDFDSPFAFTPENLKELEKKVNHLLKKNQVVTKEVWPTEKAIETFEKMGEHFKVEIIKDLGDAEISVYKQGDWFDLCRGPHVQKIGQIKTVKILSTAGAYWRGDENNPQLQRIYATAFNSKDDLAEYLRILEEAKKRDHRKLSKDLGLVYNHPFAPGAPFFTEQGTIVYNELQNYMRAGYKKYGYHEVISPQIFDNQLYDRSGHDANYKENIFATKVGERDFAVKPMNCPGHCLLYGATKKSYRDLPWRIADFGRLHRNEKTGALHGLTRVTTFCQDDAHIFCRLDQLLEEIKSFMTFLDEVYNKLGMSNYNIFFSTRPEKRVGSDEVWDKAESVLEDALKHLGLDYTVNEGDGAFYGPKLDIMFVDALKRPWQLGTLQLDFNMPNNFDLKYVGEDNSAHQPVMIHRAILGSLERFIGVYLEHTAGRLPTWLSPRQVVIMNVTSAQDEYCKNLEAELLEVGVRVHYDDRNEKLGYKIREAQLKQIPYMITVGDQEVADNTVAVRLLTGDNQKGYPKVDFIKNIKNEIETKNLKTFFEELTKDS